MNTRNSQNQGPIVRIAPSPTGFLHVGTVRTALFNYLFARQHKGTFIVRIEDTDKERSKKEYEDDILEGLKWLGLSHHAFYRQSERTHIYQEYLEKLISSDKAYVSKEPAKNKDGSADETRMVEVVRLRNPGATITFKDLIRGEIVFDTNDLGDFVIARSITDPLYHLAVVIDDHEMGVTHVIRGEDHISNTPRQILIQEAIGAARPMYAHIPLILASDRSKLSKRHGAVSVNEYKANGYLAEALVNFMALLGWNPGTEQEIFTLEELVQAFDVQKVQKGGAVFNIEKLDWFNKEYIKKLPENEFVSYIKTHVVDVEAFKDFSREKFSRALPTFFEKIGVKEEIKEMSEYLFGEVSPFEKGKLIWKGDAAGALVDIHLSHIKNTLSEAEFSTKESIQGAINAYVETIPQKGFALHPLRFALSGKDRSPDPFTLAYILGKDETIKRIDYALSLLK